MTEYRKVRSLDWDPLVQAFVSVEVSCLCPECGAGMDSLYGWAPRVLTAALDAGLTDQAVLKQACWACGFHDARYVPTDLVRCSNE